GGNQALAFSLQQAIESFPGCKVNTGEPVTSITVSNSVTTVTSSKGSYTPAYVVLAAPPTAWQLPAGTWPGWQPLSLPFTPPTVHYGPAVKYFSNVKSRFWIADLEAPSAVSD